VDALVFGGTIMKPAPIVTCARCGGTLYPGLHYCFGSYHERKLARARLECKVELAMEKRVEVRKVKEPDV
jgi:hypothetical protein